MKRLKKYLAFMKFEFQYGLRFRTDTILSLPAFYIPFLTYFFLWKALIGKGGTAGNYNFSHLVTYYLVTSFLYENSIHAWNEIYMTIKDGKFTYFLLKPFNHYLVYFVRPVAFRTTRLIITGVALIPLIIIFKEHIKPPQSLTILPLAVLFWFLGNLFGYTIEYLLNILAFFIDNPIGFVRFYWFLRYFLAGGMIPLDLIKGGSLLTLLPFQYMAYLPAKLYMGQVGGEEVIKGLFVLTLWLILAIFTTIKVYRIGLKNYKAPGG